MTVADLRKHVLSGEVWRSPAYRKKQLHAIPDAPTVVREFFILDRVKGRIVLDIGASGDMHAAISNLARVCHGWDRKDDIEGRVIGVNLDEIGLTLPYHVGVEVIVCGEVIEHLSNPGHFLDRLKATYPGVPVIVTAPNAFTEHGHHAVKNGTENVNIDHVAWYSWRTLKTLVERVGYRVKEMAWYKGKPRLSEGLIFVLE